MPQQNMIKTYFKDPVILINLFLMTLIWLSTSINTYILAQATKSTNSTSIGYETFCEIFAILASGFMFHYLGLRSSMAITFAASFLACCLLITHTGSSEVIKIYITPALSLITSATVTTSYLAQTKLFPVGCAAASLSLSTLLARGFEGSVPFLEQDQETMPIIVFAVIALGGLLATLGL